MIRDYKGKHLAGVIERHVMYLKVSEDLGNTKPVQA